MCFNQFIIINSNKSKNKREIIMSTMSLQYELMRQRIRRQENGKSQPRKHRTISVSKWKELMSQILDALILSPETNEFLAKSLKDFIVTLHDEFFKQALTNMQPNKFTLKVISQGFGGSKEMKEFPHKKIESLNGQHTLTNATIEQEDRAQSSKHIPSPEFIFEFAENETLAEEISAAHHPFSKIIQQFTLLLESSYRRQIEKQVKSKKLISIEELTTMLAKDFKFLQKFLKAASRPILRILKNPNIKQMCEYRQNFYNFLTNYLRNNEKLTHSFRKVITYFLKHSNELKSFENHCPDIAQIQNFALASKFKIQGCYLYTTSEMILLSQLRKGKECIEKLGDIRLSLYKDINQYYKNSEKNHSSLEVSSDVQLEIFKFLMTKLKIFSADILASLKLLEILFGQEQMSFRFDSASYIHSQLTIAFQAIQLNL